MQRDHAVVVGASIGGLVAARVLSDRLAKVTVVDRDDLPEVGEHRQAVPQGRHGHGLLASGRRALSQMFPALERELLAAGAVAGDVIGDVRWHQHGFYKAKFQSGLNGLLLSRPLLEGVVRAQVRRLPNVAVRAGTHVRELLMSADRTAVVGVRVQVPGQPAEELPASLVVDTGGRGSLSADWLTQQGYDAPVVESVEVDLSYTSRVFRRRATDLNGDVGAIIAPTPPSDLRLGVILAMEGNRWMATLGGWLGERAPTDPAGFLSFARSLARPDIHDVLCRAEPLGDAVVYRFPSNLRRRYDLLTRFPSGYLVLGDALCSFNPVYGQGMSVAALEGVMLGQVLDRDARGTPDWRSFFREAARIIDTPWTIAAGSDFAFPDVRGRRPAGTDLVNWYLGKVHRVASDDREVCRAFFDVANLLRPKTTLFHPAILGRVVRGCLRPQARQMPPPHGQSEPAQVARPA